MAKKKFVVAHPKHYMRVDGKMVHIETGVEITMEEKDARSLVKRGRILAVGTAKKVAVDGKAEADKAKADKAAKAKAKAAKAAKDKADKAAAE